MPLHSSSMDIFQPLLLWSSRMQYNTFSFNNLDLMLRLLLLRICIAYKFSVAKSFITLPTIDLQYGFMKTKTYCMKSSSSLLVPQTGAGCWTFLPLVNTHVPSPVTPRVANASCEYKSRQRFDIKIQPHDSPGWKSYNMRSKFTASNLVRLNHFFFEVYDICEFEAMLVIASASCTCLHLFSGKFHYSTFRILKREVILWGRCSVSSFVNFFVYLHSSMVGGIRLNTDAEAGLQQFHFQSTCQNQTVLEDRFRHQFILLIQINLFPGRSFQLICRSQWITMTRYSINYMTEREF